MNNITFKQYRNIDLFLFGALLIISEAVTTVATNKWFAAQSVAISTTFIFVCIVMMRWSGYAAIHACLGGLVFCIASGGDGQLQHYLIYIIGNCFALIAMLWFKVFSKEEVRKKPFKLLLFTVSAYLLMQLGRWLVSIPISLILEYSISLKGLLTYITTDVLTLLFGVVVMLLMRKVDGMIEDQKAYLFRLQREKEKEAMPVPDIDYGAGVDYYDEGEE